MPKEGTRMTAAEAYAAVAQPEGLLYHIAHARKENSADDYDGAALKKVSFDTAVSDIRGMRDAAQLFRERSIARG